MRIVIDHTLRLTPKHEPISALLHLLMTPQNGPTQTVDSWSIEAVGIDNAARFVDGFGNNVHLVNQSRPEGDIVVRAKGVVTTHDTHGVLGRPGGEPVPALYKRVTPLTKAPVTLYGKFRNSKDSRIDVLHALMARVGEMRGVAESELDQGQSQMQADGSQTQSQGASEETEEKEALRPSVDYAHLFIGAARALDIPARFVTGYLAGVEGLCAWAEAFDDGLGWIGFDAKYQLCPTNAYVRLAVGLDAETALPLRAVPAGEIVQTIKATAEQA